MSGVVLLSSISTPAQAGFFSAILGDEVHAQTTQVVSTPLGDNSQTLALLQANVSSASLFQDKKKDSLETNDANNANVLSDNALLPATSPMKVFNGVGSGEFTFEDIAIYVVRKGDTISEIAQMYNVSVNTILWANDMKKGDKLVPEQVLFILPISGVKHIVAKGQTLASIAKLYKVDISSITDFNGISTGDKLAIGDELIIPEAEMPNDSTPSKSTSKQYATSTLKSISGYFINPVPEYKRKSQGPHGPGNRGIDIAAPTGTRILASASGKVLLARTGYNGGYGNMVIIQHPNGTKTLYGHMSKISTKTGAQVAQGEVIGSVGSTGRSTGPHLHFEVFNAKNPGADWSWAK